MQENGSVSFIAILFKFWRKTKIYIFEKCYDQRFPAQKEMALHFLFSKKEKEN